MVSFGNFARKANLGVGFHPGALHGYFWPNLSFLLEHQIKLVLMSMSAQALWAPMSALHTLNFKNISLHQLRVILGPGNPHKQCGSFYWSI